ncbi:helix-turn-helix domain-containing protein [Agromyces aerolatus]|uniref:helix-turn-helix domain-containing protein n=1 Tax=Agromyces sp. LY-1074 TaxID=3074080 RepID=UPI0028605D93|nr:MULTISPECIES: helix-turn-helix transcriptional regulator [unclassified Agromyces]MDR5699384.1 helix-turn-helix transcriptional regulator [Agromyces sp. LY-1074]MDR5705680.1 helix-turn-helix transcriptional regulator [Agromyces sp. LY-1358]
MNPAAADFNGAVAFELRVARQDSGLTIEEMVHRSALNRSTMLRYLYNQRAIPIPALYQIAHALQVPPDEILARAARRPLAERLAADGRV